MNLALDQLILFFAGWWVFAAIAAFTAAIVFWNRGAAQLTGNAPGVKSMAVKFTGAAAIWAFSLLLFSFVNPLKGYTDATNLLLVYTMEKSPGKPMGHPVINATILKDLNLKSTGLSIELISREHTYNLLPSSRNQFKAGQPIPAGSYEMRVSDANSNAKPVSYEIDVEPNL